jgi:8-oxo-dGTP pyrophosphatase MutT (NUDIX family)
VLNSVIPYNRLPHGFLRLLDAPPDPPAPTRPSATLVLLRRGRGGNQEEEQLEVLLLKRSPRSGFIPGAWVFPGGTLDDDDGDPSLLPYLHGLSPDQAQERFHLGNPRLNPADGAKPASPPGPPAWAYWVAAIRETFEETGILLWNEHGKRGPQQPGRKRPGLEEEDLIAEARARLLCGEGGFLGILDCLGLTLDAASLEYAGHWLTPECEPRRYETRFFVTEVDPEAPVTPYEKEMVEALWITPSQALAKNRKGDFPLVFPTLVTLEELRPFQTPGEALSFLRARPVPPRLPAPERAEGGVVFKLAD